MAGNHGFRFPRRNYINWKVGVVSGESSKPLIFWGIEASKAGRLYTLSL